MNHEAKKQHEQWIAMVTHWLIEAQDPKAKALYQKSLDRAKRQYDIMKFNHPNLFKETESK